MIAPFHRDVKVDVAAREVVVHARAEQAHDRVLAEMERRAVADGRDLLGGEPHDRECVAAGRADQDGAGRLRIRSVGKS